MLKFFTVNRILTIVGSVTLVAWVCLWGASLAKNRFVSRSTWFPRCNKLSVDFDINYFACNEWHSGGNPYLGYDQYGLTNRYDHPPMVLVVFSPLSLLPYRMAEITWTAVQVLISILACVVCYRNRRTLGLWTIPLPALLAAYLFSNPLLFEIERGNWNSLILLLELAAIWALQKRTISRDLVAGLSIALATWVKMYPGLMILALLALRRWRAAGICSVFGATIGLASLPVIPSFIQNISDSGRLCPDVFGTLCAWTHTIGGGWQTATRVLGLTFLPKMSSTGAWAVLVLPLVILLSWQVARSPEPKRLLFPYMNWLLAAATYLPVIANDYNLIFLPLAALSVWDRRDRSYIQVFMLSALLWWQPVPIRSVSPNYVYASKIVGLWVVALIIAARAREQARQIQTPTLIPFEPRPAMPSRLAA